MFLLLSLVTSRRLVLLPSVTLAEFVYEQELNLGEAVTGGTLLVKMTSLMLSELPKVKASKVL